MATIYSSTTGTDMDAMSFALIVRTGFNGDPMDPSPTQFVLADDNAGLNLYGQGFGNYVQGYPTTGTITSLVLATPNSGSIGISDLSISVAAFTDLIRRQDAEGLKTALLGGNDSFSGADAVDIFYGYGGVDRMEGRGGADKLYGGDGGDLLSGGGGDDQVRGEAGDDLLSGGAGADLVDGGAGSNFAIFVDSNGIGRGANVSLMKQGAAQDTGHGLDTLVNIQNLEGSQYSDTLTGDDGANIIIGHTGGSDVLSGLGGDDALYVADGTHTADGGAGLDTLGFLYGGGGVTFSLAAQGAAQATGRGSVTASGFEKLSGGNFADSLTGDAGANVIFGGNGNDSVLGGAGDDSLLETAGSNYLRGEDGNDQIGGGTGFDDINGNKGDDFAYGALGDDWVVGGQGHDTLSGDEGADIVYGNLGDDRVSGGEGADWVRGGQGDDSLSGGGGNDLMSGDRGADTVSGGAGADIFQTFAGAGLDRVLDFSAAEGDRVMLETAGTPYTASQVGADTVVDLGGGTQLVLVGVQYSTLPPGWIIGG